MEQRSSSNFLPALGTSTLAFEIEEYHGLLLIAASVTVTLD